MNRSLTPVRSRTCAPSARPQRHRQTVEGRPAEDPPGATSGRQHAEIPASRFGGGRIDWRSVVWIRIAVVLFHRLDSQTALGDGERVHVHFFGVAMELQLEPFFEQRPQHRAHQHRAFRRTGGRRVDGVLVAQRVHPVGTAAQFRRARRHARVVMDQAIGRVDAGRGIRQIDELPGSDARHPESSR